MKHTWADPKTRWRGFRRYQRYWLNDEKVLNLPLPRRVDGREVQASVGEIYKSLEGRHFESRETTKILADLGVWGISFPHEVLEVLLTLRNRGIHPFSAQFLLYDHHSSNDSPGEFYTFFIACDGKIASEEVRFLDSPNSGFDPLVFQSWDDSSSDHAFWSHFSRGFVSERTIARFWYCKFYKETYIGQVLLLRSSFSLRWKFSSTTKTHALLWILIVLSGLILIRLWK
jgi:hypothetical protein